MNLKRLIASCAGAAMILGATAVPAFATHVPNGDGGGFTLVKNWAKVKNVVDTTANTGLNAILAGHDVNSGTIGSGAATAVSAVSNVVNWNEVDPCGCDGVTIIKNGAKVKNYVYTTANTGSNTIAADHDVDGGSIYSGDAGATSAVSNVVNTNTVGFVL